MVRLRNWTPVVQTVIDRTCAAAIRWSPVPTLYANWTVWRIFSHNYWWDDDSGTYFNLNFRGFLVKIFSVLHGINLHIIIAVVKLLFLGAK